MIPTAKGAKNAKHSNKIFVTSGSSGKPARFSFDADYYLTENIYVVNRDGVYRYHNRNPPDDLQETTESNL